MPIPIPTRGGPPPPGESWAAYLKRLVSDPSTPGPSAGEPLEPPGTPTVVSSRLASRVGHFFSPTAPHPYPFYLLTTGCVATVGWLLHRGFRRFPTADHLPLNYIARHKPLHGRVVRISDSDNFRLYHTPPLWFKPIPNLSREYMKQTIHIRLAGIDAPESKFFSMPGQPFAAEAKQWLTQQLDQRRITVIPLGKDRYNRLLGMAYVRSWLFFKTNISLKMVGAGFATIYRQHGAEYGGILPQLELAEQKARAKKRGMWAQNMRKYISPAEHKRKYLS
ncbi:putative endonuclease lcl3 [Dimargaris cristalligena]|nr:putative endonuclease lcl3 [Dimargaris cristalligena]